MCINHFLLHSVLALPWSGIWRRNLGITWISWVSWSRNRSNRSRTCPWPCKIQDRSPMAASYGKSPISKPSYQMLDQMAWNFRALLFTPAIMVTNSVFHSFPMVMAPVRAPTCRYISPCNQESMTTFWNGPFAYPSLSNYWTRDRMLTSELTSWKVSFPILHGNIFKSQLGTTMAWALDIQSLCPKKLWRMAPT